MSISSPDTKFILALSCSSAAGQVAAVTGFLEERGCYIDEIAVFDDKLEQSAVPTTTMGPSSSIGSRTSTLYKSSTWDSPSNLSQQTEVCGS